MEKFKYKETLKKLEVMVKPILRKLLDLMKTVEIIGWKKMYHATSNHTKAIVAILLSGKNRLKQ